MIKRLRDAMQSHDDNEERRYLKSWGRTHLTWSWMWFCWSFGPSLSYQSYGTEKWSAWFCIGPVAVELYRERDLPVVGSVTSTTQTYIDIER